MDGATNDLMSAITPPRPQQDISLIWRLQHQVVMPFAKAGRYDLRLYVNGELLADRSIVVELSA